MSVFGDILHILEHEAPLILAATGVPLPIIGVVQTGMKVAEQIHDQGTGPSKLAFVQGLAGVAIDQVLAVKPGLFNGDEAKTAVTLGVNAVIAASKVK